MNLLGGPDGTIYVVDMYRGVVQEQIYWTDFLKDYIGAHDLQQPVAPGADLAHRARHDRRGSRRPALSKATPAQLVQTLSHPNGWWRDKAQQLLVQRGDKSVVPQLTQLATHRARLADASCTRCGRSTASTRSPIEVCRRRLPTHRLTCARAASGCRSAG